MRLLIVGRHGRELAEACAIVARQGVELRQAPGLAEALDGLRTGRGADLLLVDVALDVAGLIAALALERIAVPIVAFGIGSDARAAVAAIKAGALEFLPLPPDAAVIAALLASFAGHGRELVHADPRMAEVLDLARQFARAEATVLLTGESGTGKEMMARFLHRHSRRAAGPFVSLNCAAIPEQLLESELFGHEKGAFTGAVARRVGKFEEAGGGTLLLDEISEMDPRLQAKLLRAIQEREIDRVGGRQPVRVDIRLIATSNRDLVRCVAEGRFREDLYFRLNVLALELPPLRERPGDIPVLARHFAARHAAANGMPDRPVSDAAIDRLLAHAWRGNVRELDNCMHRAVVLARGAAIGPEAILLPRAASLQGGTAPAAAGAAAGNTAAVAAAGGQTVATAERELILGTLRRTGGNRTHAASLLGISIRTLRNRLRDYAGAGIAVPRAAAETRG
jgi:DNA-binding NtrC family response regulator